MEFELIFREYFVLKRKRDKSKEKSKDRKRAKDRKRKIY